MFGFSKKKKNKIRNHLREQYKKYIFIKKKWKQYFESEIIIIDEKKFKNQGILQKFISLPNTKILVLRNTSIVKLPEMPKLEKLITSNSCLECLPNLPKCTYLNVCFNNLSKIENLPKCKVIHCEYNNIEKICNISKCKKLICNDNKLKNLPELPNCLSLSCSNNFLTTIPYLSNCKKLNLKNNPIEKIIVNDKCSIHFNGRQKINILRFHQIKSKLFISIINYNIWYKKQYGETIFSNKILQKLNFLNDSEKNLLFLHTILKKIFHDLIENNIIHEKDKEFLETLNNEYFCNKKKNEL